MCAIRAVYWKFAIWFLKVIGSSVLMVDSVNLFQSFRVLGKNEYLKQSLLDMTSYKGS